MKKIFLLCLLLIISACNETTPVAPSDPVDGPLKYSTGLLQDPHKHYGRPYWRPRSMYKAIANGEIPTTYDARKLGCEMPIKDQKSCGSCWAFGSVTSAEYNFCIQTGNKSPQTEPWATQPAVSCDTEFFGCGGGLFTGKFNQKFGFVTESAWPYTSGNGNTGRCDKTKLANTKPVAMPESFVYIGSPDRSPTEDEVAAATSMYGAVAVSFGASGALNNVTSEDVPIRCDGTQTNHEVTAIGFDKGKHEWIIQNSWGSRFGARGYFRMKWGCNHFSDDAGYWIFKGTPGQPPKIHLPAEYIVNDGDDLTMAVKAEANVTYEWFLDKKSLGVGNIVTVSPENNGTYRLIAKNNSGEAEIQTLVSIKK